MKNKIKLIVSDLDGTLFNDNREISELDLKTLVHLKQCGYLLAIATGRSLYSAEKSLPDQLPVDYLISSSGAGIFNWKSKELMIKYSIDHVLLESAFQILCDLKLDFSVQFPVPNNHCYEYVKFNRFNKDFDTRNKLYEGFCRQIKAQDFISKDACQMIAIVNGDQAVRTYHSIKEKLTQLKVIRSTSPIDGESIWIEIYHPDVSKANGIKFIAEKHRIEKQNIFVLGNDYNDLDMLMWSSHSLVVGNAPEDLKKMFSQVKTNNESGFSEAIKFWGL